MIIRKASEGDIKALVEITHRDGYVHPVTDDEVRRYMEKGDIYWLAETGGKPVGMFKAGINKEGNAELFIISVVLEHQRKGIGSAMLEKAESIARKWGKSELYLYTRQENKKAQEFYKKHGYSIIKEAKDVYEKGDYFLLRKSL